MIAPVLRLVKGILEDATFGVNARLLTLALASGDVAPPSVTVLEETSTAWVARGEIPEDVAVSGPVLALMLGGDVLIDSIPRTYPTNERVVGTQVPVTLLYLRRLGDAHTASAGAYYTLQAAYDALQAMHTEPTLTTTSAGVILQHLDSWTLSPARDVPGDLPVVALATAVLNVSLPTQVT